MFAAASALARPSRRFAALFFRLLLCLGRCRLLCLLGLRRFFLFRFLSRRLAAKYIAQHLPFFIADAAHMIFDFMSVPLQKIQNDLAFRLEFLC